MSEQLVVVEVAGGRALLERLHLPAPTRPWGPATVRFADRTGDGFAPSSWPPACGVVPAGLVYARAGALADVPVCADCATG